MVLAAFEGVIVARRQAGMAAGGAVVKVQDLRVDIHAYCSLPMLAVGLWFAARIGSAPARIPV